VPITSQEKPDGTTGSPDNDELLVNIFLDVEDYNNNDSKDNDNIEDDRKVHTLATTLEVWKLLYKKTDGTTCPPDDAKLLVNLLLDAEDYNNNDNKDNDDNEDSNKTHIIHNGAPCGNIHGDV
jgi:hypothetical protein